jgi:hypothetical protein
MVINTAFEKYMGNFFFFKNKFSWTGGMAQAVKESA